MAGGAGGRREGDEWLAQNSALPGRVRVRVRVRVGGRVGVGVRVRVSHNPTLG
jgi:hypothetical protein